MDPEKAWKDEVEKHVKELSLKMDGLQSVVEKLEHDLRVKCMRHIKRFREGEPVVWQHLDELAAATPETLEKTKGDIKGALGELEADITKLEELLKK